MLRKRPFSSLNLVQFGFVALLLACSKTGDDAPPARQGAALHRAAGCDDLLSQIQDDAIAKLDDQIAAFRQWGRSGGDLVGVPGAGSGGAASGASNDSASPTAPPGGESRGPDGFSETNTQVKGVDEADILKTDGERLYLLHGSDLFLLDVWPADETRLIGSAPVEGTPYELFIHEGKATVFSLVYSDLGKGTQGGVAPAVDCYDCYYGGGAGFTKISVYDVQGDAPVLERELLFEGHYVSARRHEDVVRTVLQGGFKAPGLYYIDIPTHDAFGNPYSSEQIDSELDTWRTRMVRDIRATTLEDWIPSRYEKSGDAWDELPVQCDSYYIPAPGLVQNGVTQVITFDLVAPSAPDVVSVLGGAQHVYANHEVMVLAQTDYRWDLGFGDATRTVLHEFDIDQSLTRYHASGFVPGYIHNQFSIDEQDGVIRLSTTQNVRTNPERDPWSFDTVNRVLTVTADAGELRVLGTTPKMAPGERIFSARFVGSRGYVVTFRQIDPLFVVDLADPAEPKVLGELELPGFSDYMHPLGDDHLLTIGQAGTEDGALLGVALRIFDVSDPTNPVLSHQHDYDDAQHSEASYNHKAFTFVASRNLLLFPTVSYTTEYRTALQVVQVGIDSGFTQLGSIEHPCSSSDSARCYGWDSSTMRRGLLIDDFVYAVSEIAVSAHPLDALDTDLAKVELPEPSYYDGRYGGAGGGSAVGPEPAMGGAGSADAQ